jgi:hypothetical protein
VWGTVSQVAGGCGAFGTGLRFGLPSLVAVTLGLGSLRHSVASISTDQTKATKVRTGDVGKLMRIAELMAYGGAGPEYGVLATYLWLAVVPER